MCYRRHLELWRMGERIWCPRLLYLYSDSFLTSSANIKSSSLYANFIISSMFSLESTWPKSNKLCHNKYKAPNCISGKLNQSYKQFQFESSKNNSQQFKNFLTPLFKLLSIYTVAVRNTHNSHNVLLYRLQSNFKK